MSNSPLVKYTRLSPNHSGKRTHAIDTITIHCVVGHCSLETLGNIFAPTSRQASCNYGIDDNGNVGMYCEEGNRSWCSSSNANDQRAVTIEVASDTTAPYKVTDKALAGIIELCTDICKRNGIKRLLWKSDKSLIGQVDKQNMTVHRWFANKSCPGDYLYGKHGYIADEVNKRLAPAAETPSQPTPSTTFKVGDIVNFKGGNVYTSASAATAATTKGASKCKVTVVANGKHPYHCISQDGKGVYGWVDASAVESTVTATPTFKPYTVRVTATELNIRKGPGTNYGTNGSIKDKGVYTIVEESNGWGKLKSGAGWISLSYTTKL